MPREIARNPRVISQTLQASFSTGMLIVKVHYSTIRIGLNKYGLLVRLTEKKFLNNAPWANKTKVEMFGHNAQCHV